MCTLQLRHCPQIVVSSVYPNLYTEGIAIVSPENQFARCQFTRTDSRFAWTITSVVNELKKENYNIFFVSMCPQCCLFRSVRER